MSVKEIREAMDKGKVEFGVRCSGCRGVGICVNSGVRR